MARLHDIGLALAEDGVWRGALPPGVAGHWCLVRLAATAAGRAPARLLLADAARGHVVREAWLGRAATLLHVPAAARELGVATFEAEGPAAGGPPLVRLRALSRPVTAARLALAGAASLPARLRGSPLGLVGRVRAGLGRAGRAAPPDYAAWIARFDRWDAADRDRLLARPPPPLRCIVVAGAEAALAATLDGLAAQWRAPVAVAVVADAAQLAAAFAAPGGVGYVAVLAAGEVLAPHALALVGASLHAVAEPPDVIDADWDHLDGGRRTTPCFVPGGGERLLLSGLPAKAPCLFREAALPKSGRPTLDGVPVAAAVRLSLRLALLRAGRGRVLHLPFILSHRRSDAVPPGPGALEAQVGAHLRATGLPATLPPLRAGERNRTAPVRLRWDAGRLEPVSIVVASAARSGHVLRCLRQVLRRTRHGGLELLVAVSAVDPADRRQAAVLRRLRALPHTRVLELGLPAFNYARVNNLAVAEARHETVLLLNDDVAPIGPDWLAVMQAHLQDPAVAAVGARLLYGDGRVQHGGVVLGLGGLAEHADRLLAGGDAGPLGLGGIDREVSAVTAACMLLRRADWQAVGGMDERFAVALNDVDLCLRLRAAGRLIVQANSAVLHHYESLSLGRHYGGARAGLEAVEVGLLRRLWGPVLGADPYHNPNLSLETGREWCPAWPPRVGRKEALLF